MKSTLYVGIIGDYDPEKTSHPATNDAIHHAAKQLSLKTNIKWIPTPSFMSETGQKDLDKFDCLWASSGSPFQSMEGMIRAIQIARKSNKPFIGT
jgi:CTP synthase (UTP-ammonia lyase)